MIMPVSTVLGEMRELWRKMWSWPRRKEMKVGVNIPCLLIHNVVTILQASI